MVADESTAAGAGLGEGDERRHAGRARERRPRRDGRRRGHSVCTVQVHIESCHAHSHSLEQISFLKKKIFATTSNYSVVRV